MRHYYTLSVLLISTSSVFGQTANRNYLKVSYYLDQTATQQVDTVRYFDGMGRMVEEWNNGIAPDGHFVVEGLQYDMRGKVSSHILPTPSDGVPNFLSAETLQDLSDDFYRSYCSDGMALEHFAYDDFGRLTTNGKAGGAWNNEKVSTCAYLTNGANQVRKYEAPCDDKYSLTQDGYYPAGSLYLKRYQDEDGKKVDLYSNLLGQTILERKYSDSNLYDTYYVYNDKQQLRFVLSPSYQHSGYKDLYAYEYRYDSHGNVVKKILPGCAYIQYWYDKANRLIFEQDAALRKEEQYKFYLYDVMGRIALQGRCIGGNKSLQDRAVQVTFQAESAGLCGTSYVLNYPSTIVGGVIDAVYYYDNYDFTRSEANSAYTDVQPDNEIYGRGRLTGTKERTSDGDYLYSVMSYNQYGDLVDVARTTLDGGIEHSVMEYTFTHQLLKDTYDYSYGGQKILQSETCTSYNRYNSRPETVQLSITLNSGPQRQQTIATYNYDALGRVATLKRGESAGDVSYKYDIHGWPLEIATNSFQEKLYYAENGGLATPCYNGNISVQTWKNSNYSQLRGYKYSYDGLNRLTDAIYGERATLDNKENRFNESVSYDLNGNITHLQRRGLKANGEYGKTDNLTLHYNGNQLSNVEEDAASVLYTGAIGFTGDEVGKASYQYDERGSLISDTDRGIAQIKYDSYNQPTRIQFTNGNVTRYVYTPSGSKLRTVHYTAVPNIEVAVGESHALKEDEVLCVDSTDYHGALLIQNGKPSVYRFTQGYCALGNRATDSSFIAYNYYNQDHIGNNREVVSENGEVAQILHYYPFGTPYSDQTNSNVNPMLQPYKYCNEEFDMTYGLNKSDYGDRQYDPLLCSWDRMDPYCERYYSQSPYSYALNNPMRFTDESGDTLVVLYSNGRVLSGHMAIMFWIDNKLEMYSKAPQKSADIKENGNEQQKTYSTIEDGIIDCLYSHQAEKHHYIFAFLIPTTETNDMNIKKEIVDKMEKTYNLFTSNCTTIVIDGMNKVKEPKYPKSIFPFKNLKCLVQSNNTGKSFYLQDNEVKEGELEISVKSFKQNVQDFKIPIGSWIFYK